MLLLEDVKKERRDSEHKGKRRKEGTVQELKGNDSGVGTEGTSKPFEY